MTSPQHGQPATGRSNAERIDAAFFIEECRGRELGFKLRVIAIAAISLLLLTIVPWPEVLYYWALMLGFILNGALAFVPRYLGPGSPYTEWGRRIVPVIDAALVTFALLYPNPLGNEAWMTRPMALRLDNVIYLLVFVGISTLSLSPRQVIWTGVAGAICWTIGSIWIATLPGVHWVPFTAPNDLTDILDPHAVVLQLLVKQIAVLLIITGVLAGAVARTRSLVLRQVKAERERTQLARYFSSNIVDELADTSRPLDQIRNQSVAVLFADIVGFTTLSESEPPERVIALLREFHDRMQTAVFAHGGTLDKYLGDGLVRHALSGNTRCRQRARRRPRHGVKPRRMEREAAQARPDSDPHRYRRALGSGGARGYRRRKPPGVRHHWRHCERRQPAGTHDPRAFSRSGGQRRSGLCATRLAWG